LIDRFPVIFENMPKHGERSTLAELIRRIKE
jgi:hypothetical protein